jgi:hypothetical protein
MQSSARYWPETGFEEIIAQAAFSMPRFLERDFWPQNHYSIGKYCASFRSDLSGDLSARCSLNYN